MRTSTVVVEVARRTVPVVRIGQSAWPLQRFSYVVFYVAANDEIDVWRVLQSRRDLPTALRRPEE